MRSCNIVKRLLGDNAGATAVEYGLIVSLVVIGIVGALRSVADETSGLWAIVRNAVNSAIS